MWAAALVAAPAVHAQPPLKPYVVLNIDTSATMLRDTCGTSDVDASAECTGSDLSCATCAAPGCDDGVSNDSRLWKVKRAARRLVENFGEVTYALARFHQEPVPFSCKGGGWQGADPACSGDRPGEGQNRADILVDLGEDNQEEVLSWLDGCDNWPTLSDCDPGADLAPQTGCSLCPDCGTGCDREIRATGDASLAGSLASIRQYFEDVVMPGDPPPECPQRNYAVFLFTDGVNSCDGDAAAEAVALCDIGVPVHVFGFDDPALRPTLDAIALAGCAGCGWGPCGRRCDGETLLVDDEADLARAIESVLPDPDGMVPCGPWEWCNGEDDDCDGLTDEDYPGLGEPCCDPCPSVVICGPEQDYTMCAALGPPPYECPEICDMVDNDCDGLVDEGLICVPEVCNGIDDDGDGETDEPPLSSTGYPCGTDEGECSMGLTCCQEGWIRCCGTKGPEPELWDCLDNDCDGQTDEDGYSHLCYEGPLGECPDPESGTCTGACAPGRQTPDAAKCPTLGWGPCIGQVGPRTEVCNCIDDDCDGETDDGATCADGAPCVSCQCATRCDDAECPAGTYCATTCEESAEPYCLADPCVPLGCAPGETCDPCEPSCVGHGEPMDGGDPDAGRPTAPPFSIAVGGGGSCECRLAGKPRPPAWPLLLIGVLMLFRRCSAPQSPRRR